MNLSVQTLALLVLVGAPAGAVNGADSPASEQDARLRFCVTLDLPKLNSESDITGIREGVVSDAPSCGVIQFERITVENGVHEKSSEKALCDVKITGVGTRPGRDSYAVDLSFSSAWTNEALASERARGQYTDMIRLFGSAMEKGCSRLMPDTSLYFKAIGEEPNAPSKWYPTEGRLYSAACSGNFTEVRRLLEKNANPDEIFRRVEGTALNCAVSNGYTDIAKVLLEAGADPTRRNAIDYRPSDIARMKKDGTLANLLTDAEKSWTAGQRPALGSTIHSVPQPRSQVENLNAPGKKSEPVPAQSAIAMRGNQTEASKQRAAANGQQTNEQAAPHRQPGNLDDDGYERMRASAGMAPEKKQAVTDVDQPKYKNAERPDDFALVIGIQAYEKLPEASHALNDAQAVRRHMRALGVPERNIIFLSGQNATKSRLAAHLEEWLPRNIKPESKLFVYYSGHGAPDPKTGQAHLMPWDGDPTFLKSTAYPVKELYAQLAALKAKQTIVALDACFSGAGGRSVLAAASGDEITGALDEQAHGMFTYFFLKGLGEGKRSAKQLHEYLKPLVQDEARRQNRDQTPAFLGADASL